VISERLKKQVDFIVELDRLKQILRRTLTLDGSRHENSAEHSWHLAVLALVLSEYSNDSLDLARVLKMALIHDVVEIDAGDTFVYDEEGQARRPALEAAAAERLFGLLPSDQAAELRAIWEEFEARQTPEATFAASLDRLQPILQNYHTRGAAWQANGITKAQVLARNAVIAEGSTVLWELAKCMVESAAQKGWLPEENS
jgi:putative hydrolase of HD superfamily